MKKIIIFKILLYKTQLVAREDTRHGSHSLGACPHAPKFVIFNCILIFYLNHFILFAQGQGGCKLDIFSLREVDLSKSLDQIHFRDDWENIKQGKNEIDIIYFELGENIHFECCLLNRIIINNGDAWFIKKKYNKTECRRSLISYEIDTIRTLIGKCEQGLFYEDCFTVMIPELKATEYEYKAALFIKNEAIFI